MDQDRQLRKEGIKRGILSFRWDSQVESVLEAIENAGLECKDGQVTDLGVQKTFDNCLPNYPFLP